MIGAVLKPFKLAALIWGAVGLILAIALEAKPLDAAAWMILFWALSLADLFALSKAVFAVTNLTTADSAAKPAWTAQAIFWGVLKFACLGFLCFVLVKATGAPKAAVVLGVGTMIAVPLAGGYLWSRKELKHA